jgi:hypothetical protein
MRKKTGLAVMALAGCLTLAGPSAHGGGPPKVAPREQDGITRTVVVELKGQLIWNNYHPRCLVPEFVLSVNGKQYDLYLGEGQELRRLARGLAGQTVVVTGTLTEADGRRVAVAGLKADGSVKTSVRVEIKGQLVRGKRYFTGMHISNAVGSWPVYAHAWSVRAGKETYHLDLPDWPQEWTADGLAGQTVLVVGTLAGDRVKVTSLKADKDGVRKTTVVEVKGKLSEQWVRTNWEHPNGQDVARMRKARVVTAQGNTYVLDFPRGMPLSVAPSDQAWPRNASTTQHPR